MKHPLIRLLCFGLCISLFSCKKNTGNPATSSTFTAKVDENIVIFNVLASTLLRSSDFNQKRLDVSGLSTDGKLRLILTIGEETAIGNNVPERDNSVSLFNDDNPSTPQDESDINTIAFFTLSTAEGNDFYTDVNSENGHIIITKNTVSGATGTVTGSFNGTLVSKSGGADYTITEGIFTNLKYTVLN